MSNITYQTYEVKGDQAIVRNCTVGGTQTVQGRTHLKGNVKIDGWLECEHLKHEAKGWFLTESDLLEAYDTPRDGWWALVGNGLPAVLYLCRNGSWINSGVSVTPDDWTLDFTPWEKQITDMNKRITDIILSDIQNLNSDLRDAQEAIAVLQSQQSATEGKADNAVSTAQSANTTAENANGTANNAITLADEASNIAHTALGVATNLQETVNGELRPIELDIDTSSSTVDIAKVVCGKYRWLDILFISAPSGIVSSKRIDLDKVEALEIYAVYEFNAIGTRLQIAQVASTSEYIYITIDKTVHSSYRATILVSGKSNKGITTSSTTSEDGSTTVVGNGDSGKIYTIASDGSQVLASSYEKVNGDLYVDGVLSTDEKLNSLIIKTI